MMHLKKPARKTLLLSVVSAILITVASYFVNNFVILTGENLNQFAFTQRLCEKMGIRKEVRYDDAVFVDVSKEVALVPAVDKSTALPVKVGTASITDRQTLYRFLEQLHLFGGYRYVLLDVYFDSNDVSPWDGPLFDLIGRMDRLVFADDSLSRYPSAAMARHAAPSDFRATITATNFTRIKFLQGDRRYISTQMFEELYPDRALRRWGPLYFAQGRLCQNSCFLTFDSHPFAEYRLGEVGDLHIGHSNFRRMGYDYLRFLADTSTAPEERMDLLEEMRDKVVVIGDFTGDMHDTYVGRQPGSLILFRAFQALEEGRHLVSLWNQLLWALLYFAIALGISAGRGPARWVPCLRRCRNKVWPFLADLLSFSLLLYLGQLAEYILLGQAHSIAVPMLFFSVMKLFFHYKDYQPE